MVRRTAAVPCQVIEGDAHVMLRASEEAEEQIEAAGAGHGRIVSRHILPGAVGPNVVQRIASSIRAP